MATERAETFTLMVDPDRKEDLKITIHGEEAHLRRATDLATLIERFSKWLPGMVNVTFTKHDQPACALGYQHKERLLELASEGDCMLAAMNSACAQTLTMDVSQTSHRATSSDLKTQNYRTGRTAVPLHLPSIWLKLAS
jgi:hypothetical protein